MNKTSSENQPSGKVINVPNAVTALRLGLAIVVFILISQSFYWAAMIVFLIAAGTDWIDGYWARRFNQVTQVGRIFDPFVDKVIICGAFIFLAAEPGSGIPTWVAVLVMGREMLVTALRGAIEQQGGDFSAKKAGKWKMVFQCAAVTASLLLLTYADGKAPPWLFSTLTVSLWLAILLTVYSGGEYLVAAARMARG